MNYLKKYLLSLALALCGLLLVSTAQAQENYGIYGNSDNGAFRTSGSTTSTAFTAMKDASLTFTVTQSIKTGYGGLNLLGLGNSTNPITVGVFTYTKENGQIEVKDSAIFTSLQIGSSVNTADALSVSAGDMVGMYVQRDGKTAFLTEGSGAAYGEGYLPSSSVQHGRYEANNTSGTGLAKFEMDNSGWALFPYSVDILVRVEGAFPAPTVASGTPLPGVLATMALTTLAGGYLKRRRKPVSVDAEE